MHQGYLKPEIARMLRRKLTKIELKPEDREEVRCILCLSQPVATVPGRLIGATKLPDDRRAGAFNAELVALSESVMLSVHVMQIERIRQERQQAQAREQVQASKQPLSPLGQVVQELLTQKLAAAPLTTIR